MRTLILLFALVLPFAAKASPEQILDRMNAFATAYNIGDPIAVSQFYTPDAALFAPRVNAVVGQPAIKEFYKASFSQGRGAMRFSIQEVSFPEPDTAIEIGQAEIGFENTRVVVRYLHVWERRENDWLIARDFYHVLGEAPPAE